MRHAAQVFVGILGVAGCAPAPVRATAVPVASAAPTPAPESEATIAAPPSPAEPARFRFVASANGPFPNASGDTQPRVVLAVEYEGTGARGALTERLLDDPSASTIELGDAEAQAVGLLRPEAMWLFGDEGPCLATVGAAYASAYAEISPTLELGYRIEPCAADFAPVAFLDAEPPAAHWAQVTTTVLEALAEPASWTHPTAASLLRLGLLDFPADTPPPKVHVRVRTAGALAEFAWAHHWPGDDCEEQETVDVTLGRWDGEHFDALPSSSDYASNAELVGTLTVDGTPWVAIADHRHQLQLGALHDHAVAWSELDTGQYHDEDTAYWGWSVLDGYCGP